METEDDNLNYAASDDAWDSEVGEEKTNDTSSPRYADLNNPRIQEVGQKMLDAALSAAKYRTDSLDALWRAFIEHIQGHVFAEEIARQIEQFKVELQNAIKRDCYPMIEKGAIEQIKIEIREKVEKQLILETRNTLTPIVRSAVQKQLEQEIEFSLRQILAQKIKRELEPVVREELRKELINDPILKEQVIIEIKKRIVGF
jgi:hypothetical protein